MRRPLLVVVVVAISCGAPPDTASLPVGPTGGQDCIADERVCIDVPREALEREVNIKISPSKVQPPAPNGEVFDIGPSGTAFLVPAKVTFRYDVLEDGGLDPTVLRVFTTIEDGGWQPL